MPVCISAALHNEVRLKHKHVVRAGFNKAVEEHFNFEYDKIMLVYSSSESLGVCEIHVVFKLILIRGCFQR